MANQPGRLPSATTAPPLVGREREIAALREALTYALAGRGSLVLIGGEAGVGKTALAEATLAEAAERGATALVGRCYDLAETPPYGPWRDLFDRAPRDGGLPALPAAVLPPEREGDVLGSQDAIVRRSLAYLAALGATRPLVLLLEDLHWADPASLDLLRVVARNIADVPLLLLATYRADEVAPDHPLAGLLPALVREARAARLDLPPLDAAAIGALVAMRYALADTDQGRLVGYLAGRTEGNALFLGELLRTLESAGGLHWDGERWALGNLEGMPVPTLLRQVIAGRLARLGDEDRRLLAVAAVIGQELPFALWATVGEVEEGALLVTAERAIAARVLESTETGVRFAHALIREALYEGVLAPRRRTWHRRAGEALLATFRPDPDMVASHFQRAGDPRAATWLVMAGERAWQAYAWLTAAERFEAALALTEHGGMDASERATLLLTLAQLWRYQDRHRGLAYLAEAEQRALAAGDGALAAAARFDRGHLRLLSPDARALGDRSVALAAMVAALPVLEALAPADRARLPAPRLQGVGEEELYHRGALLYWLAWAGRLGEALALAAPMIARGPGVTARGLAALGMVYHYLGQPEEAERALDDAQAAFHAAGQQVEVYFRLTNRLLVAYTYYLDQPARWRHLPEEIEAVVQRAAGTALELSPQILEMLIISGDWDEARRFANEYSPEWMPSAVARHQGDAALAQTAVRQYLPHGPATEPGSHALDGALGCQQLAIALALDAADLPTARAWLAAHDRWLAWSGAVLGRAEGALAWAAYHRAAGDHARARQRTEAALAYATAPRQPLALLAAHRLLGELDTTAGCFTDGQAHLDAALALADACAAPFERALTLLALAELRAAENVPGEANAHLAEARALLLPLKARPALARAAALAATLAHPPVPGPNTAYPAGLTAREVEVLRLIAAGCANREIAAHLSISANTVLRHVSNILAKTGTENRAAAAVFALRHGLDRTGDARQ